MAETLLAKLGEMAIKTESTKGTKNLPAVDGSESLFRVHDMQWTTDVRLFNRNTLRASNSRYPHLVGQTIGQLSFSLEMRKTAVTTTEDAWGKIARACGFAFTSVTGLYNLTTDRSAHLNLTVLAWLGSNGAAAGSVRVGMRGVGGSCKLRMRIGEPPMMDFVLFGSHDAGDSDLLSQADSLNTITHETAIPGIFHGVNLLWDSFAAITDNIEIDFGQTVAEVSSVSATNGIKNFAVTGWEPKITIDPEMSAVGDYNWISKLCAGTEVAVTFTHAQASAGGVNARSFAVSMPKVQIEALTVGERNGIKTFGVTAALNGSANAGDDEFTMAWTGV